MLSKCLLFCIFVFCAHCAPEDIKKLRYRVPGLSVVAYPSIPKSFQVWRIWLRDFRVGVVRSDGGSSCSAMTGITAVGVVNVRVRYPAVSIVVSERSFMHTHCDLYSWYWRALSPGWWLAAEELCQVMRSWDIDAA